MYSRKKINWQYIHVPVYHCWELVISLIEINRNLSHNNLPLSRYTVMGIWICLTFSFLQNLSEFIIYLLCFKRCAILFWFVICYNINIHTVRFEIDICWCAPPTDDLIWSAPPTTHCTGHYDWSHQHSVRNSKCLIS